MKICPNCNNQLNDNAGFCNNCGTQFAANPQQPNFQAAPNTTTMHPLLITSITLPNSIPKILPIIR